mmetsp:Transcript_12493/g.22601  ORF Transcript_12493/g.22601 Transcript_12493/m.22601 type:complete len:345 (-) Transcript_12493:330-1364(-)
MVRIHKAAFEWKSTRQVKPGEGNPQSNAFDTGRGRGRANSPPDATPRELRRPLSIFGEGRSNEIKRSIEPAVRWTHAGNRFRNPNTRTRRARVHRTSAASTARRRPRAARLGDVRSGGIDDAIPRVRTAMRSAESRGPDCRPVADARETRPFARENVERPTAAVTDAGDEKRERSPPHRISTRVRTFNFNPPVRNATRSTANGRRRETRSRWDSEFATPGTATHLAAEGGTSGIPVFSGLDHPDRNARGPRVVDPRGAGRIEEISLDAPRRTYGLYILHRTGERNALVSIASASAMTSVPPPALEVSGSMEARRHFFRDGSMYIYICPCFVAAAMWIGFLSNCE